MDEVLNENLVLYAKYTTDLREIPLDRYFMSTIVHGEELSLDYNSFEQVANVEKLSPKYLRKHWQLLTDDQPSVLLSKNRVDWKHCSAVSSTFSSQDTHSTKAMQKNISNLLA